MNIFYLDFHTDKCAEYHCDKHVLKMIIEYAQLLSTAHRVLDGKEENKLSVNGKTMVKYWTLPDEKEKFLYRAAYYNHPCAIWTRQNKDNYRWLLHLWCALNKEYTKRYDKVHETYKKLIQHIYQFPKNIVIENFTQPPQCMPDECKIKDNTVQAYRNFYKAHKKEFATWKNQVPKWFN